MDPQYFASKDELWRLQNEMKSLNSAQTEQAERLLRLERRQEDDTRVKGVWGANSPFAGVLSGTQQGKRSFHFALFTVTDDDLNLRPEIQSSVGGVQELRSG